MWNRLILIAAIVMLVVPAAAAQVQKEPPSAPYKKVSTLVKLPDFLPGIGTLYVDPNTLPAGPFLANDHKGRLVSTIYMIPQGHGWAENLPRPARARRQGGSCQPLLQRRASGRRGAALPHCALARDRDGRLRGGSVPARPARPLASAPRLRQ
jgi:hypothetical protein